jgi:hypothetical protein
MVAHMCTVGGTWRSGYWRHLEEAELPHHPVDGVLIDVDVEDQSSPRQLVSLVSGAQAREPCGARAATMAGAYNVHRTWASTIRMI